MKKTLLSIMMGIGLVGTASAEDLLQVYQQALQNDPATLQSLANKDAAYSGINQNRASLLPQISLELSASRTNGDNHRETNDVAVNFTQSIWDYSNWKNLDRAELVASRADANYGFAKQDLIVRTVTAYFNVLQAQDDLEFAKAEKRAIERQLEQTKQRFEVGLTAITDVHEAQAQFDTAVASEISAQNNVEITLEALREITNNYHASIDPLNTDTFSASMPAPADINAWVSQAEDRNLQLLASKIGVDIAKEDIDIAKNGHYPTVGLRGQYNSNDTDGQSADASNTGTSDGRFNTSYVELTVNVPIYSGGGTSAAVDTARHEFIATSEDRERVYRSVVRNVRSNYFDVTAAISRIKALNQAVVSAESALKATEAGFEVGTRTIVDVLQSTRNLYDAKRNLAGARYGYITSILSLKQAAGTLTEQDVADINNGLK
ncbi:outer membrane channel protein TolC [Planctobacterium marinum]|uniref:outer membrane channel protein TolC n=1 Tax=Planctobacterium marinum TaxID=1631968 RepID=UPI001E2FEDB1|nr:outer membrane channel protein TolC [Planctobacterium marinum]MCC2604919.1 outer membrane channel protein TolC [Planctobacterium marinum]